MKDIQNLHDDRRINIKKVGVKTISYPITVLDKANRLQHTVATVNMYVNLPHHFKGTHMSRFIEILNRFHGRINLRSFHHILGEMKQRLDAEAAHMEMAFPYFLRRPSAGDTIVTDRFECNMHGSLEDRDDLIMEIRVPIILPLRARVSGELPASMGRWGHAAVAVRFRNFIWIEDLISLVEEGIGFDLNGSAPGARIETDTVCLPSGISVEAVTEKLGKVLAGHPSLRWFSVTVENLAAGYSTFATMEDACLPSSVL